MQSGFHVPDRKVHASYTRWGMIDHYTGPVRLEYWVENEAPIVVLEVHDHNGLIAESPELEADPKPRVIGSKTWQRYLWDYDFTGQNGCVVLNARLIGSSIPVLPAAVCCGEPLPGQPIPVVPYDDHDANWNFPDHQGWWWIPQETAYDLKGHPIAPRFGKTTKTVDHANLWVERMSLRQNTGQMRFAPTVMPSGHITAVPKQLYFWEDRNTLEAAATWGRDGPRDVATIGHVVAGVTHPDGYQICAQTQGRVFRLDDDGTVTTLFGWRLKGPNVPRCYGKDIDAHYLAHLEYLGPSSTPMREIFDLALHPDDPDRLFIADVSNDCIWDCRISTGSMRRIGAEGYADGDFSQARFRNPRGVTFGPDKHLYVSDEYNQAIRVIDLEAEQVSTLVRSKVLISEDGNMDHMGTDTAPMREMLAIDGAFGEGSFAHPNGPKFDSRGRLFVGCHHIMTVMMVDLQARTLKHVHNYSYFNRDVSYRLTNGWITLDIDTDGVVGPKDALYLTAWSHNTDICLTNNGDDTFTEHRITRYRRMKDAVAWEGPMYNSQSAGYPWGAWVDPRGALYVATTSGEGILRITPKRADDPTLDVDRYKRGDRIWRTPHPPHGSLELKYGISGQNNLGPISAHTFGDLDEADALSLVEAEFGLTGADANDVLYYLWWNSANGRARIQGISQAPMPEPEPTPEPEPEPQPEEPEPQPEPPDPTPGPAPSPVDVVVTEFARDPTQYSVTWIDYHYQAIRDAILVWGGHSHNPIANNSARLVFVNQNLWEVLTPDTGHLWDQATKQWLPDPDTGVVPFALTNRDIYLSFYVPTLDQVLVWGNPSGGHAGGVFDMMLGDWIKTSLTFEEFGAGLVKDFTAVRWDGRNGWMNCAHDWSPELDMGVVLGYGGVNSDMASLGRFTSNTEGPEPYRFDVLALDLPGRRLNRASGFFRGEWFYTYGGKLADDTVTDEFVRIHVHTGEVEQLPPGPAPLYYCVAVYDSDHDRAIVYGGGGTSHLFTFDFRTQQWQTWPAPAQLPDNIHAGCYVPGKGLVTGSGLHFEDDATWLDAERVFLVQIPGQPASEPPPEPEEPEAVTKADALAALDVLSRFVGQ